MKFYAFLLMFLSEITQCICQSNLYHPFKKETQWSILNQYFEYADPFGGDSSKALNKFYGLADTTIDGKIYLQLKYDGFWDEPIFLIRDDSINRKVYYRHDSNTDTLLYDFSVSVGDNISYTYAFSNNLDAYIEQIDSILIGDNYRKKYVVRYLNQYYNYDIGDFQDSLISTFLIEGIGSEYGPLLNSALDNGYLMNDTYQLLCYFENGEQLYSVVSEFADCDSTYVDYSIEIQSYSQTQVNVFPNPANDFIIIESLSKQLISINLYNLQGYENSSFSIDENGNGFTVDITGVPSGFYLLKINSKNEFYIVKIVIN